MKNKHQLLYTVVLLYTVCIYGPMAAMSIGAGVLFASWLFLRWGKLGADFSKFRTSPVFWPTIFFGVACLWSLVWAKIANVEFYGMKPTISWVGDSAKAWHLFFPLVLAPVFMTLSDSELKKAAKLWFFCGAASAVLGIVQYYVPLYNPMRLPHLDYTTYKPAEGWLSYLRGSYHATGMTGFHLSYASILAFPASVALALVAVLYRRIRFDRRTQKAALLVVLFFLANVFTYSKIAWIAMPLTVLLISVIGFKGWPRWVIIALVAGFAIVWGSSSEVRLRFQGTNSINDRYEIWGANLEMIKQQPIFGVGWHRNSELSKAYYQAKGIHGFESHAHNNLIDQWASTGLFGLVGFIWWSVAVLLMCWRIYSRNHDLLWRSLGLGLIGGWFCLHLNGLTQSNWWDAKVLHQIGWVTAITMEVYRRTALKKTEARKR